MASPFAHRGIVEGFYGPPFAHEDRLWWVDALGRLGMNRYVVAPKSDPRHRERWRERHTDDELSDFAELVRRGEAGAVQVGSGVSPGLSVSASNPADVAALLAKFRDFHGAGARFLILALDDVPDTLSGDDARAFRSLAAAHVALAHAVAEAFPDATLWFIPNDYTGRGTTDYLDELGADLAPEVEVAWTGRCTLAPSIPSTEAAERAAALKRRLLLWDNVPVTDGPMRNLLHLGSYAGRDRDLATHVSGILLNPMQHARSSWLTIACAAAYLSDPAGTDPEAAWEDAARRLGAGAPDAFADWARAHRFSPMTPEAGDTELAEHFAAVVAAPDDGELARRVAALRQRVSARRRLAEALRSGLEDQRLRTEIEPWVAAHHEETRRMDAGLQALECLLDPASNDMERCTALSVFEGSLSLHPPATAISYGPRRAFYPQMVSHRDHGAGFGEDPVLYTDRNLGDAIVAFASEACLRLSGARRAAAPGAATDR